LEDIEVFDLEFTVRDRDLFRAWTGKA